MHQALHVLPNIFMFDPLYHTDNGYLSNMEQKLLDIPTTQSTIIDGYKLIGFVNFKKPHYERINAIGHFTAFIKRQSGWFLCDDLKQKGEFVNDNIVLAPTLLLMSKNIN